MKKSTVVMVVLVVLAVSTLIVTSVMSNNRKAQEDNDAIALVATWADRLDGQTKESGAYIRYKDASESEITEAVDPWQNYLVVQYSKGGFSEVLKVRSLGRDGKTHTKDDIVEQRQSTNLSGVGSGIKDNIEETAEKAGRGGASGIIQGLAEGAKKVKEKK